MIWVEDQIPRGDAARINAHWRPWLGRGNRCLVPFTAFSEPDQDHEGTRKPIWFALDESRPLAFFAGIWTPHACVRMKSKGWEDVLAYGFLTTDSAEPVLTFHKKAMPVILTTDAECDEWLAGDSWEDGRAAAVLACTARLACHITA